MKTEIYHNLNKLKPKPVSDRKNAIEMTLSEANKLNGHLESGLAWQRLCNELQTMCEPEARPPRFNALLRAIWVAATNEQS